MESAKQLSIVFLYGLHLRNKSTVSCIRITKFDRSCL